jgi:hypothetical protein
VVPNLPPLGTDELGTLAKKLEELAPDLAATYCARAMVSQANLDFVRARELIEKSVKLAPDYELARTSYGVMLLSWAGQSSPGNNCNSAESSRLQKSRFIAFWETPITPAVTIPMP